MADEEKQPKGKTIKVLKKTADALADIAEAKGQYVWQVVEDLLASQLPALHKAIQPQLKAVKELKARTAAIPKPNRTCGESPVPSGFACFSRTNQRFARVTKSPRGERNGGERA